MAEADKQPAAPEPEVRDEDSMNYLFTIVLALAGWVISGNPVFGVVGAVVGWIIDERRATRRPANGRSGDGDPGQ
ncbi:MAG: hypothetical protein AAGH87_06720 [Pseudomonadota bacterium]